MNLGSVVVEYKPVEREVWVTASGMDDDVMEAATVAHTPREALGLAWLLIRAAVIHR